MARRTAAAILGVCVAVAKGLHAPVLHTQALYGETGGPEPLQHLRAPTVSTSPYRQVLTNHGDVQYVGEISVGNQTLHGIFDTGSFELLVFSRKCRLCSGDAGSSMAQLYDGGLSRTLAAYPSAEMVSSAFGSGSLGAVRATEAVRVGPLAARRQLFWEVVSADMPLLETATFQAIIGVGPPLDPRAAAKLIAAGDLPPREGEDLSPGLMAGLGVRLFAFCVGRAQGSPAYFVWRAEDPRRWPTVFAPLPVVGKVHWALQMHAARLADSDGSVDLGCTEGCGAVIDSGTSLISAPSEVMMRLRKAIDALGDNCSSNLDKLPDFHFRLGGVEFSLPPESYVGRIAAAAGPAGAIGAAALGAAGGDRCEPLFMTVDKTTQFGPMWIIGLPFFRKYYTVFDLGGGKRGGKRGGKKIFAAEADENCKPATGTSLLGVHRRSEALSVDLSKARLPAWALSPGAHLEL